MDRTAPTSSLLELLTLEQLDTNLYRARNPVESFTPHLYGGQVAAQALRAAADTVDADRRPHSLHGYFLRAGRADRPTILAVDRDRDGGSFSSRHVNAVQDGEVIFSMLASFHRDEEGVDHQVPQLAGNAGDPESMPERERVGHNVMLEVRYPSPDPLESWRSNCLWVRSREVLPDDPVVWACVLTYISDLGWAFTSVEHDGDPVGGPSLDHAVWFQRPVDPAEWMFLELTPVTLAGARGIFTGTIHDRAGRLGVWINQETLLRRQASLPAMPRPTEPMPPATGPG